MCLIPFRGASSSVVILNFHGHLQLNGPERLGIMGIPEQGQFDRCVVGFRLAVSTSFKPFANEALRINI
jgi:hypothetical protein